MKIATFNCNSVRSRMPIILDWLARNQPDVLGLQETKCQDSDFPAGDFTNAGYCAAFRGQKSYNGVALLSRQKPSDVAFGLDDGGPADESRLIRATFGKVTVVNAYVPQGNAPDAPEYAYKLEWFRRLRAYFERHFTTRRQVAWIGDFNVAPEPMDVYDSKRLMGHVCHRPETFAALEHVKAWGFVDVFRKHNPQPGLYSYFDYRMPKAAERGLGWRVDHIFATPPLAARSIGAAIDMAPRLAEKPSDHTIVMAEFSE
ncbi:MAG TPA: exodeoxyribonuclease III [Candidatus Brocadiia bacterium]|nr:exodeoxyribonuclease III [Candidatus Brocadiia bacterium]